MKFFLALVIALTAIAALAQSENVIVEFREAPLAIASTQQVSKGPAIAAYRATFTRFRADVAAATENAGEVRWEYFEVFHGAAVTVPRASLASLERLPYVKRVYLDKEVQALAGPAVAQIGADKFWTTYGSRGKGVVVAVIDTGIDYMHEALGHGFGPGYKVIGGFDFYNRDNDPMDDNGHGTHVSGIIAGDSATIIGVAPEVSLVAYKVLSASGSGPASTVLAAIERTADPNGDGDFSDHIDVANLSLGGDGGPDDPLSRGIDAATRAGVLFCVAAGNSGRYHAVSSPGTARSALTVGAVDGSDLVASFSSRGPTPKDLTMKPEISAPGVNILSSFPQNKYGNASGTSMATPHVSGACALLKALHHDWTPAQIKAAIIGTAPATNQEIMTVGAGRVDVLRASKGLLSIDTPVINFGLEPLHQDHWTKSRSIRVTNRGEQAATYSVSTSPVAGVAATVTPTAVTLKPGEYADVTLSLDIDNSTVAVDGLSLANGGAITFNGGTAGTMRVPWSFVRAVRAILTWDHEVAFMSMLDTARTDISSPVPIDENASEVLLAGPASYEFAVVGWAFDPKAEGFNRISLLYLDAQQLDGDMTIALTEASANHLIRTATVTPDGKPMVSSLTSADQTYALSARILFPGTSKVRSLTLTTLPTHELHVNNLAGKTLFIGEMYADFRANAMYAVQHPPLNNINGDVTLTAANLRGAAVRLLIPPAIHNDAKITTVIAQPSGDRVLPAGTPSPLLSITRAAEETVWNGRVYLTPDYHAAYSLGVLFTVVSDGATTYTTPMLRVSGDAVTTNGLPVPWLYSGDAFLFGGGPRSASVTFNGVTSALRPSVQVDFFGPLGEVRTGERVNTVVSTYNVGGTLIRTVTSYPAPLDLSTRTRYTVEAVNDATQYPDLKVRTKVTMTLDSSQTDYIPPTLTSFFVLDGTARVTRELTPHGNATLYFSAADYAYTPSKTYQPVRGDATAVSYRYSGTTSWLPLQIAQTTEDIGSDSRPGAGVLYRVDLGSVANIDWARVDLKIDLADVSGNTTTVVMQPALTVGSEYPPRRRATR